MLSPDRFTAAMAADPLLSQADMQQIAASRPDLLPALASNPALYPELREWLVNHPNPEVRAALKGAGTDGAAPHTDDTPTQISLPVADTPASASSHASAFPTTKPMPVADTPPSAPQRVEASMVGVGTGELDKKGRVAPWVWVLIGVFAAVLIGGAGILGSVLARNGSTDAASTPPAPAVTSETIEPTPDVAVAPTVEPVDEPTTQAPAPSASPSPAHTQDYLLIDDESGNWSCELHEEWVGCSILERDTSISDVPDCPDRLLSVTSQGGGLACGEEFVGKPGDEVTTIGMDQPVTYGEVQCELTILGDDVGLKCDDYFSWISFTLGYFGYGFGYPG